jgi:hypothetical protein
MRTTILRAVLRAMLASLMLACGFSTAEAAWTFIEGRLGPRSTRSHSLYVGMYDNYLTVRGNGRTDLDCWVYDSDGALVDSDTDSTDYCILETPGIGTHRLVIRNLGGMTNYYSVNQLFDL